MLLTSEVVVCVDTTATHSALVDITSNRVGRDVGQRVVAVRQSHAGLSLVNTIDPKLLESCMGFDLGSGQSCRQSEEG